MADPRTFQREVYIALKGAFDGEAGKIRQKPAIRNRIEAYNDRAEIQDLIQKHGMKNLSEAAKELLNDKIFASISRARERFPDVFNDAATQKAEPKISKSAITTHEDTPTQSGACERQETLELPTSQPAAAAAANNTEVISDPSHVEVQRPHSSLGPISLPYRAQHHVLTKVQYILEYACYAFAELKVPTILLEQSWDCPESAELSRWTTILPTYDDRFEQELIDSLGKPFQALMKSITQLRNITVHRNRITADKLLEFVEDAELLVKLLKHDAAINTISEIRRHVQSSMAELERRRDTLKLRLAGTKRAAAAARAKIDREEDEALSKAMEEDNESTLYIGTGLVGRISACSGSEQHEASALVDTEEVVQETLSDSDCESYATCSVA